MSKEPVTKKQSSDLKAEQVLIKVSFQPGSPTDHRCEDGRFAVFKSYVTVSNPDSLLSSKTGVDPGIRSWKKHFSE
jgi:hypothetical protein